MRRLYAICAIFGCLLAFMAACGSSDSFTIGGTVVGNPNMNLYAKYYGNGKVVTPVVRVAEGRFQISASSRMPALVELCDNEGRPLGYLLAQNGDNLSVEINRSNPFLMQVSGTDAMDDWCRLANANAETLVAEEDSVVNALIEKEVRANPASLASAMLVATAFRKGANPALADSVVSLLDPSVRISALFDASSTLQSLFAGKPYTEAVDSLPYRVASDARTRHFSPKGYKRSILAFCTQYPGVADYRRDSLNPLLREISADKKLQIIDFYLAPDTVTWKSAIRRDTVNYTQAWAPGGIFAKGIDRLAIPAEPFYIVTDSAGRQLYRGSSLENARTVATNY